MNAEDRTGSQIGAVLAAAGQSKRMGRPKQLLPWSDRTVIETVVDNLSKAGARPVICVVGHFRGEIESALRSTSALVVYNEAYASSGMLSSYQAGIASLAEEGSLAMLHGVLLALGDQPHVGEEIIRQVIEAAHTAPGRIVIPSHNMRRGHPIYLPRRLWSALLSLGVEDSLRKLLDVYADDIVFVNIEADTILRDMDTPAEYEQLRPSNRT